MFRDREYTSRLFTIALPLIFQYFVSAALNVVDVTMIGQMGEATVAAVGLANQIFFLLNFLLFGVSSGSGVFTAQFWGVHDIRSIRKVLGISLTIGLLGSIFFSFIAIALPKFALGIYTNDPVVLEAGAQYLQIVGLSYILTAVTASFASVQRSTGNVRLPMAVSAFAILLKTLLNFGLIFGNFGLPALGIIGAAIATTIARAIECLLLVFLTYYWRTPASARLKEMFGFSRQFLTHFLKTALPVVFNETLWSFGITTYNIVYAHIGTEAIAAMNIASTIENLAFVIFIGISDATGIMVGNKIGAGEEKTAFQYARWSLMVITAGAILVGVLIAVGSDSILNLYRVSAGARTSAHNVLLVISLLLWVRVSNMTLIVGILRSGGDTRFAFALDAGTLWAIGVPSAVIGAFLFNLPVYWVYALVMSEEIAKYIIGLVRFRSRRWIRNLVQVVG